MPKIKRRSSPDRKHTSKTKTLWITVGIIFLVVLSWWHFMSPWGETPEQFVVDEIPEECTDRPTSVTTDRTGCPIGSRLARVTCGDGTVSTLNFPICVSRSKAIESANALCARSLCPHPSPHDGPDQFSSEPAPDSGADPNYSFGDIIIEPSSTSIQQ